MRYESIVGAVFALGTAASAWFAWPWLITFGCAVVAAVFSRMGGARRG
ncbi:MULTISPECIES: hypothetical protein [Bifidobacterium]|nr:MULTISPECIES: hypothetical protein [Bifidobacterium]